jgi:hypothetical protein
VLLFVEQVAAVLLFSDLFLDLLVGLTLCSIMGVLFLFFEVRMLCTVRLLKGHAAISPPPPASGIFSQRKWD